MSFSNWIARVYSAVMNRRVPTGPTTHTLAFPSDIRIRETYTYYTEVSNIPNVTLQMSPSGAVEIMVPSDEWQNLAYQEYSQERVIEIHDYQRTDLDARLRKYRLTNNSFPLHEVMKDAYLRYHEQYADGQPTHRITISYTPATPWEPLQIIKTRLFDQNEIHDQRSMLREQRRYSKLREEQTNASFTSEQIVNEVIKQVGFKNSLIFEFRVQLILPEHVHLHDDAMPVIRRMALTWPVITSHRQVWIEVDNQYHPLAIDPASREIVWENIAFERDLSRENNSNRVFFTPFLHLGVNEPVELYLAEDFTEVEDSNEWILGEVVIELPCLLSGLYFAVVDGSPVDDEAINLDMQTIIKTNLRIHVREQFEQRTFSPYQHLQFPNVVLTDMRRADIILLLRDLRFEVNQETIEDNNDGLDDLRIKRHLITAERREGARKLKLWLVVEGISSGTTREKEIPGNEKFTTPLPTGSMTIYIRGQIEEDQHRVVQVINQIHDHLKERFRHVSIIE